MAGWVDRWREVTVAIGRVEQVEHRCPDGRMTRTRFFAVVGTGVLFGVKGRTHPFLVTARHVFSDPGDHWQPSSLYLLFSWSAPPRGKGPLGVPIRLSKGRHRYWMPHPNPAVDLACLPLHLKKEKDARGELPRIMLEEVETTEGIVEGTPVIVLGYPGAVGQSYWPRAIVRQGIVAWVSPARPRLEMFLIDSHVFPGNSGGPVFKQANGIERTGRGTATGNVALLGIVSQARIQSLPLMAGGREVEIYFKGKKTSEALLAPSFIGIGLVEPAYRIKQLLAAATRRRRRG